MSAGAKPTVRKLSKNQRLVFDFFKTFSRFEYALKEAGYLKGDATSQVNAEPNWDGFADSIKDQWDGFFGDADMQGACDYLLQHPPMKQIAKARQLGWVAVVPGGDHEARFVLRCVRTIRNNLFHGGKRMKLTTERDVPLLRSGLEILGAVLPIDDDVKRHFEDEVR